MVECRRGHGLRDMTKAANCETGGLHREDGTVAGFGRGEVTPSCRQTGLRG